MKLTWGVDGQKIWNTGVENVVLFPRATTGTYEKGVAWNGVTKITDKPTGAETKTIYADDGEYANITSKEKFEGSIEAYMYPEEFAECDGSKEVTPGMKLGQQQRKQFGLCYKTIVGNDLEEIEYGYKLMFVYGAKASVSQKDHNTIGEEVDPGTMSWDFKTTPVKTNIEGAKPTATVEVFSKDVEPDKLAALEDYVYGTENTEAMLPTPDQIYEILTTGKITVSTDESSMG